jgi:hypothetical protein
MVGLVGTTGGGALVVTVGALCAVVPVLAGPRDVVRTTTVAMMARAAALTMARRRRVRFIVVPFGFRNGCGLGPQGRPASWREERASQDEEDGADRLHDQGGVGQRCGEGVHEAEEAIGRADRESRDGCEQIGSGGAGSQDAGVGHEGDGKEEPADALDEEQRPDRGDIPVAVGPEVEVYEARRCDEHRARDQCRVGRDAPRRRACRTGEGPCHNR